jgi:predicted nucleic acid-binding protein
MTIIDANLLLYAYNANAPQQKASAQWLQELLKEWRSNRPALGNVVGIYSHQHQFQNLGEPEFCQGSICNRWRMAEATRRRFHCTLDRFMLRFWKNSSVTTEQPVRW